MIGARTPAALAQLCEQATGNEDIGWFDDLARAIHEVDPRNNVNGTCRDYPRSLDCARTLVPANCTFSVQTEIAATVYLSGSKKRWHGVSAASRQFGPPLALCAAALRAIAELELEPIR